MYHRLQAHEMGSDLQLYNEKKVVGLFNKKFPHSSVMNLLAQYMTPKGTLLEEKETI
jgi:hypothetical protein